MRKSSRPVGAAKMPQSESVRVEKISNGFLAHHSKEGPSGYTSKTVFHAQKPTLVVPKLKKGGK